MRIAISVFALYLSASLTYADVKPVGIFAHHMVLQRNEPVPVWGTASAGEKVVVSIAGKTAETTADSDGRWLLTLDPLEAGGPFELVVAGNNTLTFKDVLIGEVWVCSGQSNMAMKLEKVDGGAEAVTAADDSALRQFRVRGAMPATPTNKVNGKWESADGKHVSKWSAAAYFFGMRLRDELGVPVAIVNSTVGWTPAEAWMSRQALEGDPKLKPIMERWDAIAGEYPAAMEDYGKKILEWKAATKMASAEGKPLPPEPQKPRDRSLHQHHATFLYNGMVAPLMPYAIRGVIWYQGETNASRADQYRTLFPALIRDWRSNWGQGDFPFLYVQIAPLDAGAVDRAELRDAQRETLALPNTAMIVTLDIGEQKDEHPGNKKEVGRRLALAALNLAYGKDLVYSGPLYKNMKIEGDSIRLVFDHAEGGLVARGGALKGFTIAGADKKFVPAKAEIDGGTVVVSSPNVENPVAVRYCFRNWPGEENVTLFNKAGLPASSFRTDDWPLTTKDATKMIF